MKFIEILPGMKARSVCRPWRQAAVLAASVLGWIHASGSTVNFSLVTSGAIGRSALRQALLVLTAGLGASSPAWAEDAQRSLSTQEKLDLLANVKKWADEAFNAKTVQEEEAAWTRTLERVRGFSDVEVRIVSNRGNSRARQGKLNEALEDYNRAIELVPTASDPHLNRGAVYESLGRLEEALADYDVVLKNDQQDPAAWNNRGNALLGLKRFEEAAEAFEQALSLTGSQSFAFAAVNLALTQFELRQDDAALRGLRALLARYSEAFPDARAAYALILWDRGDTVEGESQWDRATTADPRYRSLDWVTTFRRWPPRMTDCLRRYSQTTAIKVK